MLRSTESLPRNAAELLLVLCDVYFPLLGEYHKLVGFIFRVISTVI